MNLFAIRQAFPAVKLIGTDISREALAQLQTFLPGIPNYRLDATQDTLDEQYDMVISLDVLEHIEDDVAVIRNMHKMTKKYVLISTLQGRKRDFEKDKAMFGIMLRGTFSEDGNSGFKIEKTIQWGWPLFFPRCTGTFFPTSECRNTLSAVTVRRKESRVRYYIGYFVSIVTDGVTCSSCWVPRVETDSRRIGRNFL